MHSKLLCPLFGVQFNFLSQILSQNRDFLKIKTLKSGQTGINSEIKVVKDTKKQPVFGLFFRFLVGVTGFEPVTQYQKS